jgi:FAD/FMN-containing dehydrogenase
VRQRLARRGFLQLAATVPGALLVGFDPAARAWVGQGEARARPFEKLPKLDGSLLLDEPSRQALAHDLGGNFQELPAAVLRPGSVEDVVRLVQFANEHHLPIAMRGQGHSQYGQSLVGGGIVVESAPLGAVKLVGTEAVDVQAGASWASVTEATLAQGRTPRVMPDVMLLSVGGLISVGGWGNSSHHFGAVADTVEELDVVTGDGQHLTCSARRNRELFETALAGLGQVALIVRARLRLQRVPSEVVRRDLFYDDLGTYVADAARLASERRFDHLGAKVIRKDNGGGWTVRMTVGLFSVGREPDLASLESGLRFTRRGDLARTSYAEYLQREVAAAAALRAGREKERRRSASLAVFLPLEASRDFAERVLASPSESAALWRVDFCPLNLGRFTRPLFKLPGGEVAFSLWLFRSVAAAEPANHAAALEANRAILERMRAVGGKAYPPYVRYTHADWRAHYGPQTWARLEAAKKRYDPKGVLTPGPGVFAG